MSSIEKDIKLIELVEQYKHIYDNKNEIYSDRIAVQNAWESIGKEMQISASECKHRWETIRKTYKEKKGLSSGAAAGAKQEWPCLKYLGFLQDVVARRKRFRNFRNVPTAVETAEVSQENIKDVWESGSDDGSNAKQPCVSSNILSEPSTPRKQTSYLEEETPSSNSSRHRSRDSSMEKCLISTISTLQSFVSAIQVKKTAPDSDMMFCLSLYETLKGIKDKRIKNRAKISILESLDQYLDN